MHRGRRCLVFLISFKGLSCQSKGSPWWAMTVLLLLIHPRTCETRHISAPKIMYLFFCYGSSFTKRDLLFFSRAELSWSLNIKVRSSPAPCIIAHFILLSFFPLPWYHHTHQQEAVLQPPSEMSLLLGRTIHTTTTVYSTGYIILQLGVHTVAKIWNKESNQPREVNKMFVIGYINTPTYTTCSTTIAGLSFILHYIPSKGGDV